ncbi:hypothetical protein BHU61_06680 [Macrococcus epidermidis]|uniref:Uncharacterized protein n=1 Tax=Macrococcus epidermidis TaxID=1902580 RepID=A0A327ZRP4_9STAP|nr:hypothetical protein [Macrococcus epidermidis]RAK44993.1 hypothetical protein BHU61_06680 [Macrococcus epidermidis]
MAEINNNTINIKFDEVEVNKIIKPIQTEADRVINKLDEVLAIQSEILCNQPIKSIALDSMKISKSIEDKIIKQNVRYDKKKDSINVINELKEFLKGRYEDCMNDQQHYKDEIHAYEVIILKIKELEALQASQK